MREAASITEAIAATARDPAVRSCCVVCAPDPDLGEVPVAFVVARDGSKPQEKSVRDRVAAQLPRACVPMRVITLDALPETGIGQIDRKLLKQLATKS
jgi:acyl-coenzyme A synthetase/AMP-(fatty) acid ligase